MSIASIIIKKLALAGQYSISKGYRSIQNHGKKFLYLENIQSTEGRCRGMIS